MLKLLFTSRFSIIDASYMLFVSGQIAMGASPWWLLVLVPIAVTSALIEKKV